MKKANHICESKSSNFAFEADAVKQRAVFCCARPRAAQRGVEPVFGHITSSIGLTRFSLRGWVKVNIQWKLFCIVHNLTKIHRYGFS